MALSRTVELVGDTTGELVIDLTDFNPQGAIFSMETAGATTWSISELIATAGPTTTRCRRVAAGGVGRWRNQYFGFPVSGPTMTLNWTAGQTMNIRVLLVQEPIRPFGTIPILEGSFNLAAVAQATPLSAVAVGYYKHVFMQYRFERPGAFTLRNVSGSLTIDEIELLISGIRGATGGAGPFSILPVIDAIVSNYDAVNTNSVFVGLYGVLG